LKLIADSTCDLSDEILAKYDITICPLTINIDGVEFVDRKDMTPDEFYGRMATFRSPATTALPSPKVFLDEFINAKKNNHDSILCICMSSGTSGSYQSAVIAKDMFLEEYPEFPIYIVDSKSMSHGSGLLILKSALLRESGYSFNELIDFNEKYKLHVKHFLSVDDLDNLIRSGRLTNVSAMIGKILKLKPIMTMRDGKGAIIAKERGRKAVLDHYVKEFISRNDPQMVDFIIIGYTSDLQYARNLELKLRNEAKYENDIYIMQMGMAVGTHVGLGGLSMFFIEKDRKRDGLVINEINKKING
jgi:DegV family protein with EDD domain